MTEQGRRALIAALRIISRGGKMELVEVDTDIRPYFASAPARGDGLVEVAIKVVVAAIDGSAKNES